MASATPSANDSSEPFSSEELARLVIDALLRAKVLPPEHSDLAVGVATEEIEVRRIFGDVSFPRSAALTTHLG
jgi:hypothetical protein